MAALRRYRNDMRKFLAWTVGIVVTALQAKYVENAELSTNFAKYSKRFLKN